MGRGRRVADMDLSPGGWEGWKEAQRDADVGLWWTCVCLSTRKYNRSKYSWAQTDSWFMMKVDEEEKPTDEGGY